MKKKFSGHIPVWKQTYVQSQEAFRNLEEREQDTWQQIVEEMRREWVPERQTD